MATVPLLRADDSLLLIIDVQTRLAAGMPAEQWTRTRDGTILLARAAAELALPVVVTRQYPRGLGDTDPDIVHSLPDHAVSIDKTCFSAAGTDEVSEALRMAGRSQVVVCGMETHVCVLQTVAGLAAAGYEPFVVADAVCSRDPVHERNALARMAAGGASLTNRESAIFEWLRDAGHESFKTLAALVK